MSSSVQSLNHVHLFATPWTAACQASLSITNSWSLPKLVSIELVGVVKKKCCKLLILSRKRKDMLTNFKNLKQICLFKM